MRLGPWKMSFHERRPSAGYRATVRRRDRESHTDSRSSVVGLKDDARPLGGLSTELIFSSA